MSVPTGPPPGPPPGWGPPSYGPPPGWVPVRPTSTLAIIAPVCAALALLLIGSVSAQLLAYLAFARPVITA